MPRFLKQRTFNSLIVICSLALLLLGAAYWITQAQIQREIEVEVEKAVADPDQGEFPLAPQLSLAASCSLPKGHAGAVKGMPNTNVKGAFGKIITKSPKLCDTSAPPETNVAAWVGVIYKDANANPPLRWTQTGWNKGNMGSSSGEVYVYAEWTKTTGPHLEFWVQLTTMNATHKYGCELTDVANGKWKFYYDDAPWYTTNANTIWQSILGNELQYMSEMDHGEDDCPGTSSGSGACVFSNLKYLDSTTGTWKSAGFTAGDKWVKDINGNDKSNEWEFN